MYIYCVFLNSTWPRGAIDLQLSLTWPRSAIAFYLTNIARWLAVSYMANTLLVGLEVPWHFNHAL